MLMYLHESKFQLGNPLQVLLVVYYNSNNITTIFINAAEPRSGSRRDTWKYLPKFISNCSYKIVDDKINLLKILITFLDHL